MPDPKQKALGDELFGTPMESAGSAESQTDEPTLFRVAYAYEQASDWHKQHPEL